MRRGEPQSERDDGAQAGSGRRDSVLRTFAASTERAGSKCALAAKRTDRQGRSIERQQAPAAARQRLGWDHHPFGLDAGRPMTADQGAPWLAGRFQSLDQVAAETGVCLPRAREKLAESPESADRN